MRLSTGIIPQENIGNQFIDGYVSAGTIVSNAISLKHVYGFSVSCSWPTTGTPVGTFTLECCNDIESPTDQYPYAQTTLTNWVTIASSSQLSSAGVAITPSTLSSVVWNYSNTMYRFFRIKYIPSSGTITLTARVQIKAGQ